MNGVPLFCLLQRNLFEDWFIFPLIGQLEMNFGQFSFWTHPSLSILPIIVLYCILSSFKFPVNNSDLSLTSYIMGLCVFLHLAFLYRASSWDTFFSVFLQLSLKLKEHFQKSDPKSVFIFSPQAEHFLRKSLGLFRYSFHEGGRKYFACFDILHILKL